MESHSVSRIMIVAKHVPGIINPFSLSDLPLDDVHALQTDPQTSVWERY